MADRVVLVLAGSIGAGKSTAARYLAAHYRIEHRSFVQTIWVPILNERGLEVTRENLQHLGIELIRERGPARLVDELFDRLDATTSYAIDDVRSPSVFEYAKARLPECLLLYLDTSFDARYPRLQQRDGVVSVDEQRAAERMPTELGIEGLRGYAAFTVVNDGSQQEFEAALDVVARSLGLERR